MAKEKKTIKRIDMIKGFDQKELGYFFCELLQQADVECEDCPVEDRCWRGHTGFVDWLGDELEA